MKLSDALRISMERFDPLGGAFFRSARDPEEKSKACVWGGIARVINPAIGEDKTGRAMTDTLHGPMTGYGVLAENDNLRIEAMGGDSSIYATMQATQATRDLTKMKVRDFPMLGVLSNYTRYRFFNDFAMKQGVDPRPMILDDMLERGL